MMLLVAALVIVLGALVFTNAVEALGQVLRLGDAALGSLVAAWGTAMPEAIVPLIALLIGAPQAEREGLGIGAILGAPLLLATIGFGLLAVSARIWRAAGRRKETLRFHRGHARQDLSIFLITYAAVFALSFVPLRGVHIVCGVLLVLAYVVYGRRALMASEPGTHSQHRVRLFFNLGGPPRPVLVVLQLLAALALLIGGARLFVQVLDGLVPVLRLSPFVLSVVLTPLATELPELLNSVVWLRDGRDELAIGNVTGAMVFQATVLPAFGLWFSSWQLTPSEAVAWAITSASALLVLLAVMRSRTADDPWLSGFLFYALFLAVMGTGIVPL